MEINYILIITAAFFVVASPGPATLSIAGTSMNRGRLHGATLAAGILTGSLFWSCSAAFGLSAIMYTNAWLFELVRYVGACYLIFLAYRAARSAINQKDMEINGIQHSCLMKIYLRGVAIHLTNPKAILFYGSLYAIVIPSNTAPEDLFKVIGVVGLESRIIFQCYAYVFSISKVRRVYLKLRRWFEEFFAIIFGIAGFKILTAKLNT
ncbi:MULTISPECIES: LysE family translocator [unclassified Halomonas]|uniref:LysE family translocator n=1 Tax=unclassified Halomonas TaxID=2609666 RepID=UPI0020768889|nr:MULTISPECIES: LysE family translocator [unclassified Halomonas]